MERTFIGCVMEREPFSTYVRVVNKKMILSILCDEFEFVLRNTDEGLYSHHSKLKRWK